MDKDIPNKKENDNEDFISREKSTFKNDDNEGQEEIPSIH